MIELLCRPLGSNSVYICSLLFILVYDFVILFQLSFTYQNVSQSMSRPAAATIADFLLAANQSRRDVHISST